MGGASGLGKEGPADLGSLAPTLQLGLPLLCSACFNLRPWRTWSLGYWPLLTKESHRDTCSIQP